MESESNFVYEYGSKSFNLLVLGNNQDGCLLTGDKVDVTDFKIIENPFSLSRPTDFKIKVGMSICGIILGNLVKLWGKLSSQFVELKFDNKVDNIKIADTHLLILSNGEVFAYGEGKHGELGLGKEIETIGMDEIPKKITNLPKIRKIYTDIRTSFLIDGIIYSLKVLEYNSVYCFGSNRVNELGLISKDNKSDLKLLTFISTPVINQYLKGISYISTGFRHTVFITKENNTLICGDNSKGCLAVDLNESNLIKNKVCSLMEADWGFNKNEIRKVKCGWNNTFILTNSGEIYSTGYGKFGQLGWQNEDKTVPEYSNKFKKVEFESNVFISEFISGTDFFIAVDHSGKVYSWGWNEHFNLGLGHQQNGYTPQKIDSTQLYEFILGSGSRSGPEYKFLTGGAFIIVYK